MTDYDCIIIGLGIQGLSTIYNLGDSYKNLKILGIEQYDTDRFYSSSKGPTRITREAYFLEFESYKRLIQNSHNLWRKLEKRCGEKLFLQTGVAYIDKSQKNISSHGLSYIQNVCDSNNFKYKLLKSGSEEIKKCEPFFKIKDNDHDILIEYDAGILLADKIFNSLSSEIKKMSNVTIKYNSKVDKISKENEKYCIFTSNGKKFTSTKIVISTGPWIRESFKFFPSLEKYRINLKIESAMVFHIKFKDIKRHELLNKPFYIFRPKYDLYGFPDLKDNNFIKISIFHYYQDYDNEKFEKEDSWDDYNFKLFIAEMSLFINDFNENTFDLIFFKRCNFTNTSDEHFIIDFIPNENKNAIILSACSGHGFKFGLSIGEHVTKLLYNNENTIDSFKLSRFDKNLSKF